jgi:hypothetical protein
MAERILHNSPPNESNKTKSSLDSGIRQNECRHESPEFEESIPALDGIPPLIREATVGYLPRPADYCVGILEETVANLTRLHEDLIRLQEMLVKGGVL